MSLLAVCMKKAFSAVPVRGGGGWGWGVALGIIAAAVVTGGPGDLCPDLRRLELLPLPSGVLSGFSLYPSRATRGLDV